MRTAFPLEGAYNVRHLGGYRTADGSLTSPDVFRSGSLELLTPAGAETLASRVSTVIDLRSAVERETKPAPDLQRWGVEVRAAPVLEQDASPVGLASSGDYSPARRYAPCLEEGGRAYRTVCEVIAGADGGVLFHCSAGKDRAGVGAALMLDLAGVSDEDIIEDYTLSDIYLQALVPQWISRLGGQGVDPQVARQILSAPREAMESTLSYLRRRWGSAEGYLRSFGASARDIAGAKERLRLRQPSEIWVS